jgi:hypothetical protein
MSLLSACLPSGRFFTNKRTHIQTCAHHHDLPAAAETTRCITTNVAPLLARRFVGAKLNDMD